MQDQNCEVLDWRRAPKEGETICHMKVKVETTVVAGKKDAGVFLREKWLGYGLLRTWR